MEKVAILGCSGAGKSSLARQLGARLGLPVTHLDAEFWRPGWVMAPRDEQIARQSQIVGGPRWVVDGNYDATLGIRLAAADTVIYLDFPRWLCLCRIVRRRLQFARRTRPDRGAGCREHLTLDFIVWVWNYRRAKRPPMLQRLRLLQEEGKTVLRLSGPADVRRFLAGLP